LKRLYVPRLRKGTKQEKGYRKEGETKNRGKKRRSKKNKKEERQGKSWG
jgi:hypothetical protein